jgi:hypothetical protein
MDDGAGLLVCWHAVRLIHTLGLRPRRTVSFALLSFCTCSLHVGCPRDRPAFLLNTDKDYQEALRKLHDLDCELVPKAFGHS